ncbi:hypothetical protein [Burkholderia cenocepacia]|uniref:hypothetical protein n=1 Tax=Burkholderia cenocepacia TaxID=95486 RepID=UPI00076D38B6|nr:hypothetical protein [Burkholderia cenocepacia]KWU24762.1 hypothetical protein AS149_31960 [Burkholderia cenocepacia]
MTMNAAILPFRIESVLPATSELGNPDQLVALSDFENEADAQVLTQMVVEKVALSEGPITAAAAERLAGQLANDLTVDEDGVARLLLRSVATQRRPSGRIGAVGIVHLTMHAERRTLPEGEYVTLRIGTPVVHLAGSGDPVTVAEGALLHMLEQAEDAAAALADVLGYCADDCVTWNLPLRSGGVEFLQELNSRLVHHFYVRPNAAEMPMAA